MYICDLLFLAIEFEKKYGKDEFFFVRLKNGTKMYISCEMISYMILTINNVREEIKIKVSLFIKILNKIIEYYGKNKEILLRDYFSNTYFNINKSNMIDDLTIFFDINKNTHIEQFENDKI